MLFGTAYGSGSPYMKQNVFFFFQFFQLSKHIKLHKKKGIQSGKSKNQAYSQQGVVLYYCPMHNQGDVKSRDLIMQIKEYLMVKKSYSNGHSKMYYASTLIG